jgi:hypothetical protein
MLLFYRDIEVVTVAKIIVVTTPSWKETLPSPHFKTVSPPLGKIWTIPRNLNISNRIIISISLPWV